LKLPCTPQGNDILQSPNLSQQNNVDHFERQYQLWAGGLGKSVRTIQSYLGALKNTIPNWLIQAGISSPSLLSIPSLADFETIAAQALQLAEFQLRDAKGKGMYSAALKSYQKFLEDIYQVAISHDIDVLVQSQQLDETEKARLINTRMGQGQFRNELIQYWQGCALTQYKQLQFLVASHIKPWRVCNHQERLNPFNGLLLLANVDKAFDLGYITFTDKGRVVIAVALDDHQSLGIQQNMEINIQAQHQDFMAYHREQVFIN
jgi:hypothetical protein